MIPLATTRGTRGFTGLPSRAATNSAGCLANNFIEFKHVVLFRPMKIRGPHARLGPLDFARPGARGPFLRVRPKGLIAVPSRTLPGNALKRNINIFMDLKAPQMAPTRPFAPSVVVTLDRLCARTRPSVKRIVPRAQSQDLYTCNAAVPEGIHDAAWDPEGLLPPAQGGHFARRGLAQPPIDNAPPNTGVKGAQQIVSDGPSSAASLLLAKRTPQPRPSPLAGVPPPPPTSPVGADAIMTAPEMGIGAQIEAAFLETFWGERAAPRVLASFRRLRSGQEHVQLWPGEGLQRAESYIEGLSACAFPDPYSGTYPWLEAVEKQADVIIEEFEAVTADASALQARGANVWVPAARKEAVAYGPSWRTLVVQDRGIWDPVNSLLFPRTKKLLMDVDAPTLEVFFARQQAGTGIASHTDNANFVQTSHLGLDIPEGKCWIKVGEHTRQWRNGKVLCMDTSFMHETSNESDRDRYVLIMRHWHPELSPLERLATLFLFAALDDSSPRGIKAAQKAANKAIKDLGSRRKGLKKEQDSKGGGGFGFGRK